MIPAAELLKRLSLLILLVAAGIFQPLSATALPIVIVEEQFEDSVNIQDQVLFFIDSSKTRDIYSIINEKFESLTLLQDSNFLNHKYYYWATFSICNDSKFDRLLLYCGEFDHIRLFQQGALGEDPVKAGLLTNYLERAYQNERYMPIVIPQGQTLRYYVRISNELRDFRNEISFSIQTKAFEQNKRNKWIADRSGYDTFFGFFFGATILFLAFSAFQFFYYQDKAYLFYIGYLFTLVLYYLRIFESGTQFNVLFSYWMEWYYYFEAPIPLLCIIAYIYFLIHFLGLPEKNPSLHKLFRYSAWGVLAYIFIDVLIKLFSLEASFEAYFYSRLFGVFVGIYAVIGVLKLRDWLTFFIIIGSLFLLLGGGASILIYAVKGSSPKVFNDIVLNSETDFWKIPISYMQIGIILEVFLFSVGLSYRNKILITEKEENERKWAESELKALKAQLNPHFIFNSLNSVIDLIQKEENEDAEDYIVQFSFLLRKVLENSERAEISLEEEMETCRQYLSLEKLRFKGSFQYSIIVSDGLNLEDIFIPPFLFQPYLENAIWHGLLHKEAGRKEVQLKVHQRDGFIVCEVDDNGIGRLAAGKINANNPLKKRSFGMNIIRDRLKALGTLGTHHLTINIIDKRNEEGEPCGTIVEVLIPHPKNN